MPTTENTTTAQPTVTVGQGRAVHYAARTNGTTNFGGNYSYTLCGAEGRGMRISRIRPTTAAVTCKSCTQIAG
jgi:hypothetical protein